MGGDNEDGFTVVEMQYSDFCPRPMSVVFPQPALYKEIHHVLPNKAHFAVL